MNMLRFELVSAPNFREFVNIMNKHKRAFYETAMQLVVADILAGIAQSKAISGGSLPSLEPSTIAAKGHEKPLVDKGKLSDEFTYRRVNMYRADKAEITIKPVTAPASRKPKKTKSGRNARGQAQDTPRDQVAFYLQVEGVGRKKKKFPFFGISQDAGAEIISLVDDIVARALGGISK